ncbi:MAG: diguanylate cyclase [Lachnospiraceae bacterium]|nr:diguanylate cyclase [Lachnospiraceae bacterium]
MNKILVVDDEPMMLMLTRKILSEHYTILTASNAEEAIEIYENEKPDMILTDLLMPGMTGFEMHKLLSEKHNLNIPVMYMTADDTDEAEGQGFNLGAADFIRKPFRADVLLRRVGNIIDSAEKIKDLKEEATTDKMTGLLNKAGSLEAFTKACSFKSGVFMMIDLDSFKLVNDLHGHESGDAILICFASVLKKNLRSDDIIGRMGGDEFAAFAFNVKGEKDIAHFSERINEEFLKGAKQILGEDMNIPLGASVGAVFVPDMGREYEVLFKMADKALYGVKQNGKHGYAVYEEVDELSLDSTDPKEDIKRLNMILEERNVKDSALFLGQEDFAGIYRFLVRFMSRYNSTAFEIVFSLMPAVEDMKRDRFDEIVSAFGECAKDLLRKSDVMMQSKNNQFLLICPELEEENVKFVIERILATFDKNESAKEVEVIYAYESIHALNKKD